jgi:ABC-type phosphate transport system substrate-binding protein
MKTKIYTCLILLFTILGSTSIALAQESKLAVVANEKGAPETITEAEIIKIFKGEKQWWKDGTKIVIAFMKTSTPTGSEASKKVLGMSGDQLNKHWLSLVFQGKAKAPVFFNTEKELVDFVSQNKGAIGIVHKNQTGNSRTVAIDQSSVL